MDMLGKRLMHDARSNFFYPDGIYLLSHALGCLPKAALIEQSKFFHAWQLGSEEAWPKWLECIDAYCESLASLMNTQAKNICPQVNISSALTKLLYALPFNKDKNIILMSKFDFPTISYIFKQAENIGYKVVYVDEDYVYPTLEPWFQHLKENVAIVHLSHVYSNFSYQLDIKTIVNAAKKNNIFSIVDVAHSLGVIPVDVKNIEADAIIGTSVKWLCGGPGAGFLYIHEQAMSFLTPADTGWFSVENPFLFQMPDAPLRSDAKKFLGGTPSPLPFYVANASLKLLQEIGMQVVYEHNQELLEYCINEFAGLNCLEMLTPQNAQYRGGTLVFKHKNPYVLHPILKKHKVMYDSRLENGFRFSPHIYNSQEEIVTLMKIIKNSESE